MIVNRYPSISTERTINTTCIQNIGKYIQFWQQVHLVLWSLLFFKLGAWVQALVGPLLNVFKQLRRKGCLQEWIVKNVNRKLAGVSDETYLRFVMSRALQIC